MKAKRRRFATAAFRANVLTRASGRMLRWAAGFALLPAVWASGKALWEMAPAMGRDGIAAWGALLCGAALYGAIELLLKKPMTLYVFGHELTHALSGLLSGARVHSFKVGARGGEVRLSKSNPFVALSPYVFPIYALLLIVAYSALRPWWHWPGVHVGFRVAVGAALAFHASMTWTALHRHQPDLKIAGFFLSGVLVGLGNLLILGLFGVSLFKATPTLRNYAGTVARETASIWIWAAGQANDRWVQPALESRNEHNGYSWTR